MHLLWVFYKKQPVVDKMESKIGAIFAVYWLIVVVGYSLWSLFANAWEYSLDCVFVGGNVLLDNRLYFATCRPAGCR